jgi:hypothetical protein
LSTLSLRGAAVAAPMAVAVVVEVDLEPALDFL